jgi:hypothetical protein
MKYPFILVILACMTLSCGGGSDDFPESNNSVPPPVEREYEWTIDKGLINGSDNPFPLAKDPVMFLAKNVEFLADDLLVAAVSLDGEVKIYPYNYLNNFESVNDRINGKPYAITYCPLTQSALLINGEYKNDSFILRASGYLLHDNVILKNEKSDTYWSQMMGQCIKGSYAGEFSETLNFVEMTWKTVKENFPEAKVFTNSSVTIAQSGSTANKADVKTGDLVYGVISGNNLSSVNGKSTKVFIYHYDDFGASTTLKSVIINNKKTLVIGNKSDHYITSYINDSNASFEAVQNNFPVVMKDSDNNQWNVFGQAISGPRQGDQLQSHTGFFALFWAWEKFYDNFSFDE